MNYRWYAVYDACQDDVTFNTKLEIPLKVLVLVCK